MTSEVENSAPGIGGKLRWMADSCPMKALAASLMGSTSLGVDEGSSMGKDKFAFDFLLSNFPRVFLMGAVTALKDIDERCCFLFWESRPSSMVWKILRAIPSSSNSEGTETTHSSNA